MSENVGEGKPAAKKLCGGSAEAVEVRRGEGHAMLHIDVKEMTDVRRSNPFRPLHVRRHGVLEISIYACIAYPNRRHGAAPP